MSGVPDAKDSCQKMAEGELLLSLMEDVAKV